MPLQALGGGNPLEALDRLGDEVVAAFAGPADPARLDVLGNVEEVTLARYHRVVPWRKDASCSPGGGTINSIDLDGWPDK